MEYSLDASECPVRSGHSAPHHELWREVRTNDVVLNVFIYSTPFHIQLCCVISVASTISPACRMYEVHVLNEHSFHCHPNFPLISW